jgi:hypothetical protein
MFPRDYNRTIFVALHGSWNRGRCAPRRAGAAPPAAWQPGLGSWRTGAVAAPPRLVARPHWLASAHHPPLPAPARRYIGYSVAMLRTHPSNNTVSTFEHFMTGFLQKQDQPDNYIWGAQQPPCAAASHRRLALPLLQAAAPGCCWRLDARRLPACACNGLGRAPQAPACPLPATFPRPLTRPPPPPPRPAGRPMSFLQLLDGSLLVSDSFAGAIYRVTYELPASRRRPPPRCAPGPARGACCCCRRAAAVLQARCRPGAIQRATSAISGAPSC